ncbi:MAG: hypothetical protein AVDCRST_MAG80-1384, partial [uncultured Rubrobacteraceae bacterium]
VSRREQGRHPTVDRGLQRARLGGRSCRPGSRPRSSRLGCPRPPGGLGGLEAVQRLLRGGVPRPPAHGAGHRGRGGHGRGSCGLPRHPPRRVPRHPTDRQGSGLLKHGVQPRSGRQGGGALGRARSARTDAAARCHPRA